MSISKKWSNERWEQCSKKHYEGILTWILRHCLRETWKGKVWCWAKEMNNWIGTTVKHVCYNAMHDLCNFIWFDKHYSFLLRPIQSLSPTSKELHGWAQSFLRTPKPRWVLQARSLQRVRNNFVAFRNGLCCLSSVWSGSLVINSVANS